MFQFHSENCSLKSIQPEIPPHKAVLILRFGTVNTNHLYRLCQLLIIGNNHPAVTESAQILAWKEGKTTHMPDGAGLPSLTIPRSNRLGRIFDHMDAFAFSNLHDRFHYSALAEQMDGHDRFCPSSNFLTYLATIEVESLWIDIHKYRARTEPCDHSGSSEERISTSDPLVSRFRSDRH